MSTWRASKDTPLAERIERRLAPGPGGCIIWTGALNDKGYGTMKWDGSTKRVHRLTFEMANGPIPEGLFIDHRCQVPACVNPEHLRLATHKQNREHLTSACFHSPSGIRGVSWHKREGKWRVRVKHNNRVVYERLFANLEEARAASIEARNRFYTHNDHDRKAS